MSIASQKVSGVIFDMDGVLCDSEAIIARAACRMFRETYGAEVRPEDFIPFVGTGENRYLGGVAEKYGLDWNCARDKARTYELYLQMIPGLLQPLGGVLDFVADCRSRGLKLAVATSADKVKMDGNLREIRLPAESFDVCLTGGDVEHKKPHPEIFVTAAARLGLPSANCLVIEDAINGVQAAKAAGSPCLALTSGFTAAELRDAGADWVAPDLAAVPEEIVGLFAS